MSTPTNCAYLESLLLASNFDFWHVLDKLYIHQSVSLFIIEWCFLTKLLCFISYNVILWWFGDVIISGGLVSSVAVCQLPINWLRIRSPHCIGQDTLQLMYRIAQTHVVSSSAISALYYPFKKYVDFFLLAVQVWRHLSPCVLTSFVIVR